MATMARMEEGMKTPKEQRADLYLKIGVECSLMLNGGNVPHGTERDLVAVFIESHYAGA